LARVEFACQHLSDFVNAASLLVLRRTDRIANLQTHAAQCEAAIWFGITNLVAHRLLDRIQVTAHLICRATGNIGCLDWACAH
jgi:hypothetical protein